MNPSTTPHRSALVREYVLRALRKRRPWRVQGDSMVPAFVDGDLVLVDPSAAPRVGSVVVARHPYRNIEVIKYVASIAGDHVELQSPNGDDSRQFGRVPTTSVRGVVTINATAVWACRRPAQEPTR